MKITIDIKTDNAAFEENDCELLDILELTAKRISSGMTEGNLRDSNGSTVGKFRVTGK
jgi:hypothetical protein